MPEVDKALAQQFSSNFQILSQQKESRLESTVTVKSGIVGVSHRVDSVGKNEAEDVIVRGTPLGSKELPHQGRYIDLTDSEWWAHVYQHDAQKMLADPKSAYLMAGVASQNRKKDARIIAALGGSARQVKSDGTSENIALPAGQKIAAGATGLTRTKIVSALEILGLADAIEDDDLSNLITLVVTQRQISDILNDDKMTSADYNAVRLLMDAKIDVFMGCKWKKTNLLSKVGTTRYCYMYVKDGVHLGIGQEIKSTITERSDLHGQPWQPYNWMSTGAVRNEEAKVVEIACIE
ncbi:MAG: hypothetical protein EPN94_11025 [Nitrospirae bacterium]|nr:MAG: hypothetical protein EPN94_11025 [Nitrospirota bacterium]